MMIEGRRPPSDSQASSDGYEIVSVEDTHEEFRKFTFEANYNFPNNMVSHQKYTIFNVIPKFLFDQFKFFFNFFYLAITLTQFIPIYRIGFLVTYITPLCFVLAVSFIKEMWDEYNRWRRDRELNYQKYTLVTPVGPVQINSKDLRVGHIISVHSGERIPADLIILQTSDAIGSTFIKTTQLDGETDWKLRRSIPLTQASADLFNLYNVQFEIESPRPQIYDFSGRVRIGQQTIPISVESTAWADTSVASGSIVGVVAYTGHETKPALNGAPTSQKVGKVDLEINNYSSVLFFLLFTSSFIFTSLVGFSSNSHVLLVRFVLLFSFIIPISMKCNLDVSKMVYSFRISHDQSIKGAIMRNSALPEELGRVEYIFTDKTGTLTRNEMEFKKLQIDNVIFNQNSMLIDIEHLKAFLSLALCHSVTVTEEGFQSSSPDEIALVTQAQRVGYKLLNHDDRAIKIQMPDGNVEVFNIIAVLPFSSVWKSMSVVVQHEKYGNLLISKGSDSSIKAMCPPSEWVDEVVGNLAREGLRTLVFAYKILSQSELDDFMLHYEEASKSVTNRGQRILESFKLITHGMTLQCVTGVEDKLQENVAETLESLEAANIKIWMLTGDKLETAICVALSSRLFSRDVDYKIIQTMQDIYKMLEIDQNNVPPIVIDGTVLEQSIEQHPDLFLSFAVKSPAVVVCRCSPSQKELVVKSVKGVVSCAVGDGGNDVSMIQAASVGVGIVGKDGKQASMSADVSINSFCHLERLLLWHGTNSYKHTSRLSQFVMHRGVIMTATQAIYSLLFNIVPSPLYNDWLMMGFATVFTNFSVFSLIFDTFVDEHTVIAFPELYHKCQKGRYLSAKTFIGWTLLAIYQGFIIVFLSSSVFGIYGRDTRDLQSISFTSMIFTELCLICVEINRFNILSVCAEILSVTLYLIAMFMLTEAFDITFILTWEFLFKILLVTSIAVLPIVVIELISKKFAPTHEDQLKSNAISDSNNFFIL
ncbi:phospholipid-translocating P-type ATPase, flippase family protein [Trichomonas vaginalis G3]|uniref:Phospholipid-transporting ATPase n=1 Tax=Trichomonas vaginalis (strain ATCC PRA-98 / G3) TaxID=412133 RepID=A2D757_TRIV3|nr:putative phospholipid-transporting ATPase family [Trichomonas vaginalis G3]EAY23574.1 phospholipid-translocating P-type ATPase, flippase family protein [Trichomonas vaginalis G3]KAI5490071.1 putative phospholipid-transporting ATPase family [Trichomonas vaginalis G3]|eukprot:XP_001276822.1 phospholipid-translocating P-type ATPase, flippase family protein [Trichomonas vaginalis G3]